MKVKNTGMLIRCVAIPLAVGGLSAWITSSGMKTFEQLAKPPLSPPGWLFPVVWTILYVLMGIASYLVLMSEKESTGIKQALTFYGLQLGVNFFWSVFFFNLEWFLFSFFWLLLLWVLILLTIREFYKLSEKATYLLIPYLIWVTFAGYLNLGIWYLNP